MRNYRSIKEANILNKRRERKPSEIIGDFIHLIDSSHSEFLDSINISNGYDKKTIDWVHDLEAACNYAERNRLSTSWHRERIERRKSKDRAELYEKIHKFAISERNKQSIKELRHLLQEQVKTEQYLSSEREYKNRKVSDIEGDL